MLQNFLHTNNIFHVPLIIVLLHFFLQVVQQPTYQAEKKWAIIVQQTMGNVAVHQCVHSIDLYMHRMAGHW